MNPSNLTGQDVYGFYEGPDEETVTSIDRVPVKLPDCPSKDELEWYEHQPIDAERQIRLIELLPPSKIPIERNSDEILRCKIHSPDLESAPAYEALSYTWGKINRHLVVAVVEDNEEQALFATPQLMMALRRLRLAVPRFLWIDQLCIDQDNDAEKGRQIQLMGEIYRRAQRVVIWLGESLRHAVHQPSWEQIDSADLLADLCSKITSSRDEDPTSHPAVMETLLDLRHYTWHKATIGQVRYLAIYEILNRPWFRRAWVFQEASLARDILIQYGGWEVSFEKFKAMVDTVDHFGDTSKICQATKRRRLAKDSSGFEMLQLIENTRKSLLTPKTPASHAGDSMLLTTLLQVLRRVEAFNPRDLIFAFLAFQANEKISCTAESYQQPHWAVWRYAAECVIKNSSSLAVFAALHGNVDENPELPSWVPAWSNCFPFSRPIAAPGSRFRASRKLPHSWIEGPDSLTLIVKGKVIDTVAFFPNLARGIHRPHHAIQLFLDWNVLVDSSRRYLCTLRDDLCDILQVKIETLKSDLMRTLLADGSMGAEQPLRCVPEMVRIITAGESIARVRNEGNKAGLSSADLEILSTYEKLEDLALIAERKRVFYTENIQLGMAPACVQLGDKIVIVHGSKVPLIIRESKTPGRFHVISQCYLDGWMYGNPPKDRPHPHGMWWKEQADEIVLI